MSASGMGVGLCGAARPSNALAQVVTGTAWLQGHTDEPIMVESDDDISEENTQLGSPTAHPGSPVLAVGNPPPAFALSSKV